MTTTFSDLQLIEPIARAVRDEGYTIPTPIQVNAIPHVLAGRDLLGLAQTGTGKTAAFALPILQRLAQSGRRPHGDRPIAVLVLTPTRELATQIGESFAQYGKHLGYRHTVIFGGVGQNAQERALRAGIDILVATPGRLLDLVSQRVVHLSHIQIFVLDEADRMLDMGFVHDVRRVVALLPRERQTLFFSATMPPEAKKLADGLLRDPAMVAVTPVSSTVEAVDQSVYLVDKNDKRALLQQLLSDGAISRALVFTRTKHAANRVAEYLGKVGVEADAIHGNKSQGARERALARFKRGESRVMVATDIAARGIDIDNLSHVVNFDLPNVPETYVHRIGRTGRAGASGIAVSFCDQEEREYLADIERLIARTVRRIDDHSLRPSWASERGPGPSGGSRPQAPSAPRAGQSHSPRHGHPSGQRAPGGHGRPGARASVGGHGPSAPRAATSGMGPAGGQPGGGRSVSGHGQPGGGRSVSGQPGARSASGGGGGGGGAGGGAGAPGGSRRRRRGGRGRGGSGPRAPG
jgi:ATP-dependent RNA helicase RhlE